MRDRLLLAVLLLCFALPVQALTTPASVEEARVAYEAGDYVAAIDGYEAAINAGADHALVHYNLGNAYFKSGNLGEAIASYVRAQRLAPRDGRIRANLEVARAQIRDRELAGGVPSALMPLSWLYHAMSLNEWWTLVAVAFVVVVLASIARQWVAGLQMAGRRVMVIVGVIGAIALVMGSARYRVEVATPAAVVIQEEIEVRSGPGRDYNLAFRVHEGLQVDVAERRGDWWRIDLGGELVGWVPARALEAI